MLRNQTDVSTRETEARLLREYHATGDERIKRELVERLMPLARSLAMRYRGGPEPVEDLVQVASMGLVKAIDRFDPDMGRPFAGYAAPTILGELRRHFRDHVWSVHLPRGLQERTMAVRDAIEDLTDRTGRSPTVSQVAERLEISDEEVLEAMEAGDARKTVSLDAPRAQDESDPVGLIETIGETDASYEGVDAQDAARAADLDDRELAVLRMRFGRDMTQVQIAERIGVSQMQVSRIMRRALKKLLEAVKDDGRGDEVREALAPPTPIRPRRGREVHARRRRIAA